MNLNPILLAFIATAGLETAASLDDAKLAEMSGVPLVDVEVWRASLHAEPAQQAQPELPAVEPPTKSAKARRAKQTETPAPATIGPPLHGLLWRLLLLACANPAGVGSIVHPAAELPALLDALGLPQPPESAVYLEDRLVEVRRALWTTEPALIALREVLEDGTHSIARLETLAEAAGLRLSQSLVGGGVEGAMNWLGEFAFGRHQRVAELKTDAPRGTYHLVVASKITTTERGIAAKPSAAPAVAVAADKALGDPLRAVRVRKSFFVPRGPEGRHVNFALGDVYNGEMSAWLQANHPAMVEFYPRKR